MKRVLAVTALVLFGLAPAIGTACEYNDASQASQSTPEQLGLAPTPAASKAPAPVVAKAPVAKSVKQARKGTTTPKADAKVLAATTN